MPTAGALSIDDLARPLHAGHRERLRLHLIATVRVLGDPALLLPEQRRRDRRGQRGEQHREDDGRAAGAAPPRRGPHQRSASHRSIASPDASVSIDAHRARQVGFAGERPAVDPQRRSPSRYDSRNCVTPESSA